MATKKKNIGGLAAKRTLSLAEIGEIQDLAYQMGVEAGMEAERHLKRLKEPVTCPMCLLQEEHAETKRALAAARDRKGHHHWV